MNKIFIVLSIFIFLTSCSEKEPLTGKRSAIFNKGTSVQISTEQIKIGDYKIYKESYDGNYNKENLRSGFALTFRNKVLWKNNVKLGEEDSPNSGILLGIGNKLYFTDSAGCVYCIDKLTRKSLWTRSTSPVTKDSPVGTYISYGNENIFVTTSYGDLFTLNANTGKLISKVELSSPAKSPVKYYKGKLFVLQSDNSLKVFERSKMLWSHTALAEDNGILGLSWVAIQQGTVIAPYKTGEIFALNIANGEVIWSESLSSNSVTESLAAMAHIKAAPIIQNGMLYVISNCGKAACFNIANGEIVWESEVGGTIYTPTISGNAMFFLSNENDIVAVNVHDGKKFWSKHIATKDADVIFYNPVLISDGLFVINSLGEIVIISPLTGAIKQKISLRLNVIASPVVIDGIIYIFTKSGLVALN